TRFSRDWSSDVCSSDLFQLHGVESDHAAAAFAACASGLVVYFSFSSVLRMLAMASRISCSEAAYDKRIQLSSPNAEPETSETWACSSMYIQKSSALRMTVVPSLFPNQALTSGKK